MNTLVETGKDYLRRVPALKRALRSERSYQAALLEDLYGLHANYSFDREDTRSYAGDKEDQLINRLEHTRIKFEESEKRINEYLEEIEQIRTFCYSVLTPDQFTVVSQKFFLNEKERSRLDIAIDLNYSESWVMHHLVEAYEVIEKERTQTRA